MLNRSEFYERCLAIEHPSRFTWDQWEISVLEELTNEVVTTTLHRLSKPLAVIIAGNPNVGKTALLKHLFTDKVLLERYGEFFTDHKEPIDSRDEPDVTREISRLPLGRVNDPNAQGMILYDTPGLGSDYSYISNTARVALGMEQVAERLTHVRFRFYSLPRAVHRSAKFEEKEIPVDEVPKIINDRELTCLFVVNGASDQLRHEVLEPMVNWLREHFENKVVFVKTFRDRLETWNQERRDRRYEDLDAILGKEAVWVNGNTGEGVDNLARVLMQLHGYHAEFMTNLSIEAKCQRLLSASQQIPDVIIPAFFSQALSEKAETHLPHILSFLASLVTYIVYKDPTDQEEQEFQEKVKQLTDELEVKSRWVSRFRDPKNIFDKIGIEIAAAFFGDQYRFTYTSGTYLSRTPEALAEIYYWAYTLLHDLETQDDASVIDWGPVHKTQGIKWFVDQFQPHQRFLSEHKPWSFYQAIGATALTKFWETHHPGVL